MRARARHVAVTVVAISVVGGCGGGGGGDAPDAAPVPVCDPVSGRPPLGLEVAVAGLDMPVFVTAPPGDPRLFVLEKTGQIRVVVDGELRAEPFLEVDTPNITNLDDERGLLGLAFHPQYATNRRFFVFYTDTNSDTVVAELQADAADPDRADPSTFREVFFLDDFAGNHNGGTLGFGPDGYLYVGIGDGGGADDPRDYGQDDAVAFGKILRIDVEAQPYGIPPDNPYVGGDGLDEIWSTGWRNPWRWSFDRQTGDMYIGDVGQNAWEEIDVEPAGSAGGVNYGWSDLEGTRCFNAASCDRAGKVDPVFEYGHDEGCTVVGGFVYRGCQMPGYHGTYFFADYCGGWVRSFEWDGAGGYTNLLDWPDLGGADIVSFGEDAAGELYIVRQDTGQVMRIVPR